VISVWIDHLRYGDSALASLLNAGRAPAHHFAIGELALGRLRQRDVVLDTLSNLSRAKIATDDEVLAFINRSKLYGLSVGYIDAHLLTSVRLTSGILLWARDKHLCIAANKFGLLATLGH